MGNRPPLPAPAVLACYIPAVGAARGIPLPVMRHA